MDWLERLDRIPFWLWVGFFFFVLMAFGNHYVMNAWLPHPVPVGMPTLIALDMALFYALMLRISIWIEAWRRLKSLHES